MAGRPGVGGENSPAPATWELADPVPDACATPGGDRGPTGRGTGPVRAVRPVPAAHDPRVSGCPPLGAGATVAACGRATWARWEGEGSSEEMENFSCVQPPERARRLPGSPLPALTIVYTEASLLQEQLWKLGNPWDEEKEIFLNWFISKLCKYLTDLHFNTALFFLRGD